MSGNSILVFSFASGGHHDNSSYANNSSSMSYSNYGSSEYSNSSNRSSGEILSVWKKKSTRDVLDTLGAIPQNGSGPANIMR